MPNSTSVMGGVEGVRRVVEFDYLQNSFAEVHSAVNYDLAESSKTGLGLIPIKVQRTTMIAAGQCHYCDG